MGRPGWPAYYENLGDAIEAVKLYTAKIETNKYTVKDLIELARASHEVEEFALKAILDAKN